MRHGLDAEQRGENELIELAYRHNLPLVATNDIYFADAGMFEAHDALLCIADGRYVAFASLADNLTPGDSNGQGQAQDSNAALDVFVRDRQVSGVGAFDVPGNVATQMVSVNPFGYQTNGILGAPSTSASNIYPVISANGRFVAFPSDAENTGGFAYGATNLLPLDSNGVRDVFLFDRRISASVTPKIRPASSAQ